MNHCRRCDSDYEKPGTCNCYAPLPQATPITIPQGGGTWVPAPYVPAAPWSPTTVPYPQVVW